MSYIPIHLHTTWSLLDSYVQIDKLADKAAEYKLPAVCMTDHANIKGVVSFVNAMEKVGVKPIVGCELNLWDEVADKLLRMTVLCRNKTGYRNLLKLVNLSNNSKPIDKFGQPANNPQDLQNHSGGLIALMGDSRSPLAYRIFDNFEEAYKCKNIDDCTKRLKDNWLEEGMRVASDMKKIFSHSYLFTDLDCGIPFIQVLNECILAIGDKIDIKVLPSNNIHYLEESDREIHELIIRSHVESIKKPTDKIEDFFDYRMFLGDKPECHLYQNIRDGEKTLELLELIEDFSIKERPILPKYKVNGHTVNDPDQMLYDLCRAGFKNKDLHTDLKNNSILFKIYGDRVKHELALFKKIGLSAYFLIVYDVVQFCRARNVPVDIRGSATGCLINYLLDISSVDPVRPDPILGYDIARELPLSRFYNEGRNSGDNVSLPDIDIDCPPNFRQPIIEYLKDKYGKDCVAHIVTHTRFKGKGALKEVFRLSNVPNYFEIANNITKGMEDEAKISDELAEMQEDDPDYGIIQWNIDNKTTIAGYAEEYKKEFDNAIELEKVPRNQSVHAAGLIIADEPLGNLFPTCYDPKHGDVLVGIEGKEVEQLGALKLDVLGVAMLEKVFKIQEMVNNNLNTIDIGIE